MMALGIQPCPSTSTEAQPSRKLERGGEQESRRGPHLQIHVEQPGKLGLVWVFRTRFQNDAGGPVLCSATRQWQGHACASSGAAPPPQLFLPDQALLLGHVWVLSGRPSQEAGGAATPGAANAHKVARPHHLSWRVCRNLMRDHGFRADLLKDLWEAGSVMKSPSPSPAVLPDSFLACFYRLAALAGAFGGV